MTTTGEPDGTLLDMNNCVVIGGAVFLVLQYWTLARLDIHATPIDTETSPGDD